MLSMLIQILSLSSDLFIVLTFFSFQILNWLKSKMHGLQNQGLLSKAIFGSDIIVQVPLWHQLLSIPIHDHNNQKMLT